MAATNIAAVIESLTAIVAEATATNARAGYFACLYKKVTVAVAEKIKLGYFDDNERMERLDVVFANRYLEAYENYQQNKACSASWQLAFDTGNNWRPMVMHHLLAGMNAHIGFDLGIAAASVAPGAAIQNLNNDFNKINTILCDMITEVKTSLYSMWPLSKLISKLNMGKLENDIAGFSMTIARDAAWQVALDYAACNSSITQEQYLLQRDTEVTGFGNRLLYPGKFIQTVTGIFRVFEFGTVAGKIKRLEVKLPKV
jgi:hypothetical protein